MNCKVYERTIDCGHGLQQLIFLHGKCYSQRIFSVDGSSSYTGKGNPEFVGQTPRQIGMKANGFKRWPSRENEQEKGIEIVMTALDVLLQE